MSPRDLLRWAQIPNMVFGLDTFAADLIFSCNWIDGASVLKPHFHKNIHRATLYRYYPQHTPELRFHIQLDRWRYCAQTSLSYKPTSRNSGTNLGYTMFVRDHSDDVVERQETVALDLRVDVLAHRAASQQFHQLDVVSGIMQCVTPYPIRGTTQYSFLRDREPAHCRSFGVMKKL